LILGTAIISSALTFQSSIAQTQTPRSDTDVTPIAAVITITKDKDGKTIIIPQVTTIKQDEDIVIVIYK
jgi:hypothetical protein